MSASWKKNVYAIPEKPEKHVAEVELCAGNGAETLPQSHAGRNQS